MAHATVSAKTEASTVVCRLDKGSVDEASPAIIADAAERAHAATRLAQRLRRSEAEDGCP